MVRYRQEVGLVPGGQVLGCTHWEFHRFHPPGSHPTPGVMKVWLGWIFPRKGTIKEDFELTLRENGSGIPQIWNGEGYWNEYHSVHMLWSSFPPPPNQQIILFPHRPPTPSPCPFFFPWGFQPLSFHCEPSQNSYSDHSPSHSLTIFPILLFLCGHLLFCLIN